MRHLFVTLVSALLCASVSSALAQVEPRFAGGWELEPESGGERIVRCMSTALVGTEQCRMDKSLVMALSH